MITHSGRCQGCTALQELDLDRCRKFTDAGLQSLTGLTALQESELNLNGCKNLTDAGLLQQSLAGLTALQELNLEGCRKITQTGRRSLCLVLTLFHLCNSE